MLLLQMLISVADNKDLMIPVIIIVGKVEETVAREDVVVPGTLTIGRASTLLTL